MKYRISIYESGKLKKIEMVSNLRLAKDYANEYVKEVKRIKPKRKDYLHEFSIRNNYKFHVICKKFGFEAGVELHVEKNGEWVALDNYFKRSA